MNVVRQVTRFIFQRNFLSIRSTSTKNEFINVKIVDRDEKTIDAKAKIGSNILDVILDNKIDVDGFGACEGTLACSTCHVILDSENYKTLPPPVEEENDMLDLAYGLTDTSRLACQIFVEPRMKDWLFVVPKVNRSLEKISLSFESREFLTSVDGRFFFSSIRMIYGVEKLLKFIRNFIYS